MNSVSLSKDSFWEWMSPERLIEEPGCPGSLPESNKGYVHLLSLMMNSESLTLNIPIARNTKGARTLDSLSRHIPRKYLLELQYCLAAYGSVFATLFPNMLSHLDNLSYIEWLLFMEPDNEKYRDHLVHMFQVAFVCQQLMQLKVIRKQGLDLQFSSKHFVEWCQERIDTDPFGWDENRKNRVLCAAIYLSAIFHDVGYGYYFLGKYRQRLAGILPILTQSESTTDLHNRDMVNIRSSLAAKFISKHHHAYQEGEHPTPREIFFGKHDVLLSGFFHDNLKLNHSVASGIFLIDIADTLYDHRVISDDLYVAFQMAAEAAMLHDMTGHYRWLHFSTNNCPNFLDCRKQREVPIATLLCFADNLELGGRPRICKTVDDIECTFSYMQEEGEAVTIRYDASKKCLTLEPTDLILDKVDFIYDSQQNCFVLLNIPINN